VYFLAGTKACKNKQNLMRACGRCCSGSSLKIEAKQNTPKKSGDDSRTPFLAMFLPAETKGLQAEAL